MHLRFFKVGRIAGTSRHPQPRPSLQEVWHIIRASMFNQDQTHDSNNVPTVLQSQTWALLSCCFNHWGWGDGKYLGKVHRILLILPFISFGKEKFLFCRIYSRYMVACEPQTYYLSSLLSLRKTNFCREATTRNMSVVHRLDIWENVFFCCWSGNFIRINFMLTGKGGPRKLSSKLIRKKLK